MRVEQPYVVPLYEECGCFLLHTGHTSNNVGAW
jgi:hypothetical protein